MSKNGKHDPSSIYLISPISFLNDFPNVFMTINACMGQAKHVSRRNLKRVYPPKRYPSDAPSIFFQEKIYVIASLIEDRLAENFIFPSKRFLAQTFVNQQIYSKLFFTLSAWNYFYIYTRVTKIPWICQTLWEIVLFLKIPTTIQPLPDYSTTTKKL